MMSAERVTAVKLSEKETALDPEGLAFVGVRCPHCGLAYRVSIAHDSASPVAITEAIDGTLSRLESCSSHPIIISFSPR